MVCTHEILRPWGGGGELDWVACKLEEALKLQLTMQGQRGGEGGGG